jgi:glycosyltransferase involved in cell wall biosynthesis
MARSGRWQLVHAIEESVFMALLVKYCWGIPYVYDMDSSLPAQLVEKYSLLRPLLPLLRACESLAVRSARGVIAVCQTLEDGARSYEPASPVVRVEDASLLETDADAAEVVHRGIGAAGSLIVYVGNLEHYQGIDLLLEAFVHVYRRDADAQLVIVGGAEPDIQHYERRSCELGIAARTHFIGSRALRRLGRYLSLADILVSPRTKGNNTPMKIYSYMDAGKPIVATRLPTHTQVLDEEIACLTDPLPAAFADGILSLLSDRARSAALGAGARERSRRQYSPAALDFKLASFYRDVAMAVAN